MKRLENRIKKLATSLKDNGINAAVILQNSDLFYFTGTISQGVLVVNNKGDYRFGIIKPWSRSSKESPLKNKIKISSMKEIKKIFELMDLNDHIVLGMELDIVPYQIVNRIEKLFSDLKLVNISKEIKVIRSIKDRLEIESVLKAGKILAETYNFLKKFLKVGMVELDIASEVESFMRKRGHQGFLRMRRFNLDMYYGAMGTGRSTSEPTVFDGPVGAKGLYSAVPYFTGNDIIVAGDTFIVDLMCGIDGYISDATRTYHFSPHQDEVKKVHKLSIDIQNYIVKRLVDGMIPEDLYFAGIKMAEDSGYLDNFMGYKENSVKFIGHGVGLEVDELPVIAPRFKKSIKNGNVIAVEPKFFFKNWACGVENTYVVTKDGPIKTVEFPDDIVLL